MSKTNQTSEETTDRPITVTQELLESWATDFKGPVALHLKQTLLPVETIEGEGGIIYPPTYADIGYNIDTLSDGTRVALIDSVGSQANRLEPIFKLKFDHKDFNDYLVPQIEIVLQPDKDAKQAKKVKADSGESRHRETRSLLDLAHRSADAVVHASPTLAAEIEKAFNALKQTGDAGTLCALAPTSLLFGVWDSRGGSNEKRPRLVRSVIRAWDVDLLHAAAQFNSVWKALDEEQQESLKKEAKAKKTKLSEKGFADAPATFRKTKMPEYRDGSPNPEARILGGVLVRGRIEREITVNLVALRGICGSDGPSGDETKAIRKYLLGLALLAATVDIELFLREGCNLRFADKDDSWYSIPRRGTPSRVDMVSDQVRTLILDLAVAGRKHFKTKWPQHLELEHDFSLAEAKKLLAKKDEDATEEDK
jgi:CRISPR-associated protein Csb1